MGDQRVGRFEHDEGWIWWVFPTNAIVALAVSAGSLVIGLKRFGWSGIAWNDFLLAVVMMQGIGLATSALVPLLNRRRPRVAYVISEHAIACEVNGSIVSSVDPSTVRSWTMGDRLMRILDHLMFFSAPTSSRKNGPRLRLLCQESGGVHDVVFPPLIVFSRAKYRALLDAVEKATAIASRDHGGP